MKWPDALCPNCRKELSCRKVYCPHCLVSLPDRVKQDAAEEEQAKMQRAQRQHLDFLAEFDKRAFELVLGKLKALDKVTVSDLIPLLRAEGFFKKYRSVLPENEKDWQFDAWVRRRVLGLAKWWASNEVAFIGTKVEQGHPYLFYLGNNPDAIFDPSMPKKSIAQRSVNKVARTIESLEKGAQSGQDEEVSA